MGGPVRQEGHPSEREGATRGSAGRVGRRRWGWCVGNEGRPARQRGPTGQGPKDFATHGLTTQETNRKQTGNKQETNRKQSQPVMVKGKRLEAFCLKNILIYFKERNRSKSSILLPIAITGCDCFLFVSCLFPVCFLFVSCVVRPWVLKSLGPWPVGRSCLAGRTRLPLTNPSASHLPAAVPAAPPLVKMFVDENSLHPHTGLC